MKPFVIPLFLLSLLGCSSQVDDPNLKVLLQFEHNRPEKYEDVSKCKKAIRAYLDETLKSGEASYQGRASQLILLLKRNNSFTPMDYYIIWLGGRFLCEYADQDQFVTILEQKIITTDTIDMNTIEGELSLMSKEYISIIKEKAARPPSNTTN